MNDHKDPLKVRLLLDKLRTKYSNEKIAILAGRSYPCILKWHKVGRMSKGDYDLLKRVAASIKTEGVKTDGRTNVLGDNAGV